MKEYIVDANVLLRYFLNDIPEQVSEIELFLNQCKKHTVTCVIPLLVLSEVYFVLTSLYRKSAREVCQHLSDFCKLDYLEFEERDIVEKIFSGDDCIRIGFIDTYLLYRGIREKRELFTFDKKLKKFVSS